MADLPIPFTGPMVRALLREIEAPGTGKTQTRRLAVPLVQPFQSRDILIPGAPSGGFRPRYAVGDRLYVREHWRCSARWASRITLLVTEVRVQRLQDISAADARCEGVVHNNVVNRLDGVPLWSVPGTEAGGRHAIAAFSALWDQINGPGAWAENPWVDAYTFRPILGNIDKIAT